MGAFLGEGQRVLALTVEYLRQQQVADIGHLLEFGTAGPRRQQGGFVLSTLKVTLRPAQFRPDPVNDDVGDLRVLAGFGAILRCGQFLVRGFQFTVPAQVEGPGQPAEPLQDRPHPGQPDKRNVAFKQPRARGKPLPQGIGVRQHAGEVALLEQAHRLQPGQIGTGQQDVALGRIEQRQPLGFTQRRLRIGEAPAPEVSDAQVVVRNDLPGTGWQQVTQLDAEQGRFDRLLVSAQDAARVGHQRER